MDVPLSPTGAVVPPTLGDDWIGLSEHPLPIGVAADWAVLPGCGAVVLFSGTVRDHADGRDDVTGIDYEAYEEQVVPKLTAIARHARERWPEIGRMVLLHRIGHVPVGESSVVVVVSAPHRREAFEAARFGIDALKASVPIWKRELWEGGSRWGIDARIIEPVGTSPTSAPDGAS
ncbi:MAG: molybdenum cofactor biosynthesis protein MoaE [Acidimicrobiales bacterium]